MEWNGSKRMDRTEDLEASAAAPEVIDIGSYALGPHRRSDVNAGQQGLLRSI